MEDLGEKEFLARLLPGLSRHRTFVNGFGDDASVIALDHGSTVLFKIDRAAAPVAARRGWTDYRMWGRLAVTSNCSDILAGGGAPIALMIAMILPRDWPAARTVQVIEGCAEECAVNDIAFAGGDTKEGGSPELVGAAIGLGERDKILTRRGATPGDLLVLAGALGGFLGSYLQILDSLDDDGNPGRGYDDDWLEYISHPRARWREGAAVRDRGAAKCGMDTSDGLYDALSTLTASCGADIDLASLPYHASAVACAERFGIPPLNLGLGVGDWNIVYVVDNERWAKMTTELNSSDLQLTVIGEVTERPGLRWLDHSGRPFSCEPIVNQHFRSRQEDEGSIITRLRHENLLRPL
jgi:thiamine-monophosphate kinase